MAKGGRKHHLSLSKWPVFGFSEGEFKKADGLLPVTKVKSWNHYITLMSDGFFKDNQDEMVFRGQRNSSWGLVPSIARVCKDFVIEESVAVNQLSKFRKSIRGRVHNENILTDSNDDEIWALGQHYGLKTPLLDWSFSPYVALFFAFQEPDPEDEKPKNYSRAIFVLNKTKLEELDAELFIEPKGNEHSRLISQDALFTKSPYGEETLETRILTLLAENDVNVDNPDELSRFICKIHIPIETEPERLKCFQALRRMNVHYGSLFPDLIGSSELCNQFLHEGAKV
jgi:hypothetical protein